MKNSTALLCVNGDLPKISWLQSIWGNYPFHVAADGAINQLAKNNLFPDLVIGDFDSIVHTKQIETTITKKIADQNTTDAEKAILYLISKGYTNIDIISYKGKRTDHFLYHFHLLDQTYSEVTTIKLLAHDETIVRLRNKGMLTAPIGTTISLYPLFGKLTNIYVSGLQYSLENITLEMGSLCSQSNLTRQEKVIFDLQGGSCLCILQTNISQIQIHNN